MRNYRNIPPHPATLLLPSAFSFVARIADVLCVCHNCLCYECQLHLSVALYLLLLFYGST